MAPSISNRDGTTSTGVSLADRQAIANVLDRAADHIETVGWFQGDLYDDYTERGKAITECRVCAMGALNMALHGTPRFPYNLQPGEATAHDVAELIERRLNGAELADWNDARSRTQDDVTAMLRETATELRGGAA